MAKFLIGESKIGDPIHIDDIDPENRPEAGSIHCFACGDELVPKLGQKLQRHFAHKKATDCNVEAYATRIIVDLLHNQFQTAFAQDDPLDIEIYKEGRWMDSGRFVLFRKKYDLHRFFNQVVRSSEYEKRTDKKAPGQLCLVSENTPDPNHSVHILVNRSLPESQLPPRTLQIQCSKPEIAEKWVKSITELNVMRPHGGFSLVERLKPTDWHGRIGFMGLNIDREKTDPADPFGLWLEDPDSEESNHAAYEEFRREAHSRPKET